GVVAVASLGVIPDRALVRIDDLRTVLLGMALFALGTRVNAGRLRRIGARRLVLGLASWLLIAVVAYAGVRLAWASRRNNGTTRPQMSPIPSPAVRPCGVPSSTRSAPASHSPITFAATSSGVPAIAKRSSGG